LAWQAVEVAADAELHGCALERIREGRLGTITVVGLAAGAADVHFCDPLPADPKAESADDRAVGKRAVTVLPTGHAADFVEAVLDGPHVDISQSEGAVAIDRCWLELHLRHVERSSEGSGDTAATVARHRAEVGGGQSSGHVNLSSQITKQALTPSVIPLYSVPPECPTPTALYLELS
jgi:hypothetical protein